MDTSSMDKKLAFVRRMIWWLPALVFAVMATSYVVLNPFTGGSLMTAVMGALVPTAIVVVLCLAFYFGYRYMLTRNPNL